MTERLVVEVRGIVQGVGFRSLIYTLARQLGLRGLVQNTGSDLRVEVEGDRPILDAFVARIAACPPPLARVDRIDIRSADPVGHSAFFIVDSVRGSVAHARVAPDVATCDECLAELFDPADRRFRYPFTNCTHCGPRFTIVCEVPYVLEEGLDVAVLRRITESVRDAARRPACRWSPETPKWSTTARTSSGGSRVLDMLVGDPLPRIC